MCSRSRVLPLLLDCCYDQVGYFVLLFLSFFFPVCLSSSFPLSAVFAFKEVTIFLSVCVSNTFRGIACNFTDSFSNFCTFFGNNIGKWRELNTFFRPSFSRSSLSSLRVSILFRHWLIRFSEYPNWVYPKFSHLSNLPNIKGIVIPGEMYKRSSFRPK